MLPCFILSSAPFSSRFGDQLKNCIQVFVLNNLKVAPIADFKLIKALVYSSCSVLELWNLSWGGWELKFNEWQNSLYPICDFWEVAKLAGGFNTPRRLQPCSCYVVYDSRNLESCYRFKDIIIKMADVFGFDVRGSPIDSCYFGVEELFKFDRSV